MEGEGGLVLHLLRENLNHQTVCERQARDRDETRRLQMRQDLAVTILDQFKIWLEAQRAEVLPKSPLGEAIGYALNNWSALIRYTEAGFLSIDNNVAEREMKRIAIGRKNWLFVGSPRGGETAAVLFSFTSTCQRLQVEPWAYLHDVLSRLPTTPTEQLEALLPDRWQAARASRVEPPSPSATDASTPSPELVARSPVSKKCQKLSELRTSPPALVPRAHHVCMLIDSLMKWTLPSPKRTLTPPGWNEKSSSLAPALLPLVPSGPPLT